MAYISCENIALGYDGKVIVPNVSFQVEKGDYLCVIGENGIGKSTLIKTLLGLIPPISGNIEFGDDLKQTELSYLPQQTVVQKDFPATVFEVVLSGTLSQLKYKLFYGKKQKQYAMEQMKRMQIEELSTKSYRTLSGGQQQRVLLARALCATEKLLILDEPITGLDPVATKDLYQQIKMLNKEGVAIIMISHDMEALKYATHVLHMDTNHMYFGKSQDYNIKKHWLAKEGEE